MTEQETSRTVEDRDQPQDASIGPEGAGDEHVSERGYDSPESKAKAREFDQEVDEAKEEVKQLEEDPPERLEDWPSGKAKYETFGGPEHETSYEESATANLGPADVRHHEGGDVTVQGEKVDNPEEFKGEPIPGGPTDPDAPKLSGERDLSEDQDRD